MSHFTSNYTNVQLIHACFSFLRWEDRVNLTRDEINWFFKEYERWSGFDAFEDTSLVKIAKILKNATRMKETDLFALPVGVGRK